MAHTREINITGMQDWDLLRYDAADEEFKRVTVAQVLAHTAQAAPSVPAAITGGDSPTEAEHNALRTTVASIVTKLQTLGLFT